MGKEYQTALAEIPPVFFEKPFVWGVTGAAAALFAAVIGAEDISQEIPNYLLPLASLTTCVIGVIMDRESTIRILSLIQEADQLNINHPLYEGGPLLSPRLSPEEFEKNPKQIFFDLALIAISPCVSPIGFSVGWGGSLRALNNSRKAQRLQRAIEIAQQT